MKLTVLILCSLLQLMVMPVGYGQKAGRAAEPGRAVSKDVASNGIRLDPFYREAYDEALLGGALSDDALVQTGGMLEDDLLLGARRAATQSPATKCPQLVIACPLYMVEQDTQLRFSALVAGRDPNSELSYTWTLSGGMIDEGQGTASITVNTAGRAGRRITATVRVIGLGRECQNTASCAVQVATSSSVRRPPDTVEARRREAMEVRPAEEVRTSDTVEVRPVESPAGVRRLDVYGDLLFDAEKTRLASFARQLRKEPDAQGYIIVYGGKCSAETQAQERAERAKEWLINRHDIDASRLVTIDGGYRENLTTEIFIGPIDASLPELTASVRPLDQSRCK